MTEFTMYTLASAPKAPGRSWNSSGRESALSRTWPRPWLVPPRVLEAYATLHAIFARGSFTPVEREIVAMTTSYDNQCTYCMAAHSTFAKTHGAAESVLNAVRAGKEPNDPRLAALTHFTHQVVRTRGQVSAEDIRTFLGAGFTQPQLLEVLIGVSQATLASLVHHMARTPLDEGSQSQAWAPSA